MINDIFGHHGGDELLRKVAERLRTKLGTEDMLCRLGGDEFAVIMTGNRDLIALKETATAVSRLFCRPFSMEAQEVHITCSVGISVYPNDATDMRELIRHADIAMYRAKTEGKNTYQLFVPEMNDRIKKRALLEAGLRRALEKDEFTLNFQPQYDLQSTRMIGAEVLLRWSSPELGNVSPLEFIPVAEDSGLIIPIGDWVMRTACEQIADWQRQGFSVPRISINLSVSQLRHPQIARHILHLIKDCAVDPRMIELELTESVLMENVEEYIGGFAELQASGINLSIDDFGTGYSSMAYLKRLPLDKVKIDRAFINDLPHADNDRQIVTAMIAMAHNLGLTVTAEGVERQEQADFLRDIGCDSVQGYYFNRPLSAHQFEALLPGGSSSRITLQRVI
jgi:diguanylate cyclase (GGDEF)-like protein